MIRRVPLPLALILALALVEGIAWSLVMPALQGPDEVSHFSYVQKVAETQSIPWKPGGATNPPGVFQDSDELLVAESQAGIGPLAANVAARPYWTDADEQLWAQREVGVGERGRANAGFSSAFKNPPLYYLYEAVPYELAKGGSFFDRQYLMRLANVPLLLIALVFVWLVAGELVGRGWPQVLATSACALLPQMLNVTATVNPDVFLVAVWSAAIWVMVLLLRRGPQRGLVAALALLCVAGAFTHGRSLPLFVPAVAALGLVWARSRGRRLSPALVSAALGGAYALALIVASGAGRGSVREFVSYVWQFYLPRLGFMTPKVGPPGYGARDAFTERLYGTLAQLEVVLPRGAADWLHWLTLAGLVALVAALIVQRERVRANATTAWVLGLMMFTLVAGLHFAAYRAMLTNPGDPLVTARYLLPLLPLFGIALALVARPLPRLWAGVFAGGVVGLGVVLQLMSIGLLVERFYA